MSETPLAPLRIRSHKGPYDVHFDDGALEKLNRDPPPKAHFLVDARVAELYGAPMSSVLKAPSVLRIEAAEPNKSLERFPAYVEHLVSRGVRRGDRLVAIGGGILQDIACFLAATLLRGLDWEFYPTTLLAQADSCIGSKSSINCGATKNVLGTFTPPKAVHISLSFLKTLDERDIRSGIGEMLKVHAIDGPASFDRIADDYERIPSERDVMARYLRASLEVKKRYIEEDEFDQGPRLVFNYGHTLGHAIEAATDFAVPHGIAVTIGIDMANWLSLRMGIGAEEHYRRMHGALAKNYRGFEGAGVPIAPFLAALAKDKKNIGKGEVTLILPDRKARIFRASYPNDEAFQALCREYLEHERGAP